MHEHTHIHAKERDREMYKILLHYQKLQKHYFIMWVDAEQ